MPWGVGKRDSCPVSKPWAVYLTDSGKVAGCHRTQERAQAHQRALYANEPDAAGSRQSRSVMHEHMIVPVEWKTAAGAGPGELEGYASVFGNVDQGGDVVLPGAFRNTLRYWAKQAQPLPLIADHQLSTDGVIGSVHDAREDATGLRVRARFSADPKAQSIRGKMIEGHIRGLSFTYEAVKHHLGTVAGKSVRYLQELKLFEATVTPFPMNELAIGSAKAADSKKPYGDVTYADPGYQSDGVHRYPLDSEAHCRAAWSYINQADNAAKYSSEHLALVKGRIRAALKRYGAQVSGSASLDFAALRDAMHKALDIPVASARKAAADALLDEYVTATDEPEDEADSPADEPDAAADAAAQDTPGEGDTKGTAEGLTPREFADQIMNSGTADGSPASLDQLEARILNFQGEAS
jgi:HK97 family phage prohead protease